MIVGAQAPKAGDQGRRTSSVVLGPVLAGISEHLPRLSRGDRLDIKDKRVYRIGLELVFRGVTGQRGVCGIVLEMRLGQKWGIRVLSYLNRGGSVGQVPASSCRILIRDRWIR